MIHLKTPNPLEGVGADVFDGAKEAPSCEELG
jgi:hypothetical protein